MDGLTLKRIPKEHYSDYRYRVIFEAYKWDPQVGDHNTVAEYVVLLDAPTAKQLGDYAEQLAAETANIEQAMIGRRDLAKKLGLPNSIIKTLERLNGYDKEKHVRLMRFDFHPTTTGWAVSEVNSDVPGGMAEASVLPKIAKEYFLGYEPGENTARHLAEAFLKRTQAGARIAFVHATSYADDRQVMQFLGDYFENKGYRTLYAAPDHIAWEQRRAMSLVEGEEGPIDAIVRFFPLEWLENLPRKSNWRGFYDTITPSCNHPAAIFAQSKRLPLIWDELSLNLPVWKKLLPETIPPKVRGLDESFIYKPALGRVGEGISIQEAITKKELAGILKAVRKSPKDWIAQRRFISEPVRSEDGESFHLCIGVFTVDGKAAGFYGRISPYARIDANAKDIPLLVEREEHLNE